MLTSSLSVPRTAPARQPATIAITDLQTQLDWFTSYYNDSGGRARVRGCRFLNAETQNINVPGMLFYRRMGCFQRSSAMKDPSFDTTSATAQLVRATGQH